MDERPPAPSSRPPDAASPPRPTPAARDSFRRFFALPTRWLDNDMYGHVNNTVYYGFFDTVVNQYLIAAGVLEPVAGPVIGLVVETQCRYFKPLSFPEIVTAGLAADHAGRSSVTYRIGLFRHDEVAAAADGRFIHVYVDRATRRPVALPAALRAAVAEIAVAGRAE